ncbi:MAG TPA: HAMP domain-containing sensor histidine kinase [Chitinispirillaceae bacterium]|nr:HAMP domain-containing sensor histidine kinase [Chitinispirillaceae bacterium]
MKKYLSKSFILKSTVIGAIIGFLLLHPIVNILAELFHLHPDGKLHLYWADIAEAILISFSYNHWPMAVALTLLSASIGYLFGKTIDEYETISEQTKRFSQIGMNASTIIHDLNNTLATISGFTEILKHELKDPEKIQYCDFIQNGTKNVERMARDIKIAAMNPDAVYLVQNSVNLAFIVNQIVKNIQLHARVEIQIDDTYDVRVDEGYFERVLWNLIKNADEALAKNPEPIIRISASQSNSDMIISISDNGPGIPESIQKKLFSLGTTFGKRGGTGIGLYSSKKIIEAHNGKIWFESEKDNGTTFYIRLPE